MNRQEEEDAECGKLQNLIRDKLLKAYDRLRTLLRAIDEQKADLTELQNAVNWWSSECKRLDNDYSLELCELLMAYRKRGKMKTASPVKNND